MPSPSYFLEWLNLSVIPAGCQHRVAVPSVRFVQMHSRSADRGPNNNSLHPPLAAVIVVAPNRGGLGSRVKLTGYARGSPTRGAGGRKPD